MTNETAAEILSNYRNGFFGYKIDDVTEACRIAVHAIETGEVYMKAEDYNLFMEGYKSGMEGYKQIVEENKALREELKRCKKEYTFEEAFQKTVCEQRLYCPKRPKGEWIEIGKTMKNGKPVAVRCNKCGKSPKYAVRSDFCPNCGADMRKGGAE